MPRSILFILSRPLVLVLVCWAQVDLDCDLDGCCLIVCIHPTWHKAV